MTPITSAANPAVRAARRLASGPRRTRESEFLVEGPQAVAEAMEHLTRLFVTSRAAAQHRGLVARARAAGAEVLEVTEPVLASLADTVTPQGVVGVARMPAPALAAVLDEAALLVVLVEAQDPGNVGTAVRTADAFGADAVVLTRGSADVRTPKAVRASTGSLFHLPVVAGAELDQVLDGCRARGTRTVATTARATSPVGEVDLTGPVALVFGNEARGLPDDVVLRCDAAARVPIHGRAESLNLAATVAVVGYEAARQRRELRG